VRVHHLFLFFATRTQANKQPSSFTQDGSTALILSATIGHVDVVRLLLDSKADILAAKKVLPYIPACSSLHLDFCRDYRFRILHLFITEQSPHHPPFFSSRV
jgi:hypothetical protein